MKSSQAQLFNVMSMLWDNMLQKGAPQMEALRARRHLPLKMLFVISLLLTRRIIIINTKKGNEHALEFLRQSLVEKHENTLLV